MSRAMDRRRFLQAALTTAGGVALGGAVARSIGAQGAPRPQAARTALPTMTVYKSASCGCCKLWVDHVRASCFTARTIDTEDLSKVKAEMGVPAALQSCHTVVVGNYLVEGHVPAVDITGATMVAEDLAAGQTIGGAIAITEGADQDATLAITLHGR